jgi:hypothetical protein
MGRSNYDSRICSRSPHSLLKNMTPEEAVKKKEWKEAMMVEYQSIMYEKLCVDLKESL